MGAGPGVNPNFYKSGQTGPTPPPAGGLESPNNWNPRDNDFQSYGAGPGMNSNFTPSVPAPSPSIVSGAIGGVTPGATVPTGPTSTNFTPPTANLPAIQAARGAQSPAIPEFGGNPPNDELGVPDPNYIPGSRPPFQGGGPFGVPTRRANVNPYRTKSYGGI